MDTNDRSGIFIAALTPQAPLPTESSVDTPFRVTLRIAAFEQDMHLDIEVFAHGFDEAAQKAYSRVAFWLANAAKLAKETSDTLFGKLRKPI